MTTPYWLDVEPITPEPADDSETDSTSDFQDSGIFSGTEDCDRNDNNTTSGSSRSRSRGSRSRSRAADVHVPGPPVKADDAKHEYFTSLARPRPTPRLTFPCPETAFTSFTTTSPYAGADGPLFVTSFSASIQEFQKRGIFSVVDTAAILRQSGDFLNQQHSSQYLKTSLVRGPSPNVVAKATSLPQPTRRRQVLRKQSKPCRSPKRHDPNFRGVIVKFRLRFLRRRQHRLLIKSKFCCYRRTNRCRYHKHASRLSGETSSSDSDHEMATVRWHCREGKQCASCTTRKTPLWRDADDGTPLCNACGIRYKKYRIRCISCWYVPRKANKSYPVCLNCGDRVQHSNYQARRASVITER